MAEGKGFATESVDGEPYNRRRSWDQRKADAGYKRVTLYVRPEQIPIVQALKVALRGMSDDDLSHYQREMAECFALWAQADRELLDQFPDMDEASSFLQDIAVFERAAALLLEADSNGSGRNRLADKPSK